MREVIMFYAYDDVEFFNREDCVEYEMKHLGYLKEVDCKYSFFDINMNLITSPIDSNDIGRWIEWLDEVILNCVFINRHYNLSEIACKFIDYEFGYPITNADFNNILGWFKYDNENNKWVKVDE